MAKKKNDGYDQARIEAARTKRDRKAGLRQKRLQHVAQLTLP